MRRIIWGVLVVFFVLFSLVPMFYELSRKADIQPNRHFELVHNFYTDYNFYLSRIRQGREGATAVKEKYTSEPHAGSYIQIMYLLMGKVSAWLDVPWPHSDYTYHTARIVLAATLLFLISYASKWAFERARFRWAVTAFLLAITAGSWPIAVFSHNEWRLGGYMPWWSMMDTLQRLTFIPHMLAGQALIVFLLVTMAHPVTMRRPANWIFLGFLAFLLGVVFPAGLMFVFVAWGIFALIDGYLRRPIQLLGPVIIGLISAPALLYFSLIMKIYPWKRLIDYALLHPQPFELREYLLAVGPILLFGAVGGIWALVKREKRMFMFVSWVVAWIALIVVFQYIPQESPLRFTEMMPHVPLGILTAYLFYDLYMSGKKNIRALWIILPAGLILVGLGHMYSSWRWQKEFLDQKIVATQPLVPTGSYVMYPLKDLVTAMIFIQDHTSRDTVILSETTVGNYIPVYSGNTVYVGQANTVNTEQKEGIVRNFFAGNMTVEKAKEFLTTNNLHYIFFGPQEAADGGIKDLSTVYPFLTRIYVNTYVQIYNW